MRDQIPQGGRGQSVHSSHIQSISSSCRDAGRQLRLKQATAGRWNKNYVAVAQGGGAHSWTSPCLLADLVLFLFSVIDPGCAT